MVERIQSVTHHGKKVIVIDLVNCNANEVERTVRLLPDTVTTQPRGSVLIVGDFTGAMFDGEAVLAMKETAVFDKPYVKKSAWVGMENLPAALRESIKNFSRREFPIFKTRLEALNWLTED